MKINKLAMVMFGGLMLCGCAVPQLPSQQAEQLTVAKAQREIKVGMTSAQVVEALGSPNMVTTDAQRRETWVYDKVSTNVQYSKSKGGGLVVTVRRWWFSGISLTKSKNSYNHR